MVAPVHQASVFELYIRLITLIIRFKLTIYSLLHGEERLHLANVCCVNSRRVAEISLLLFRLLRQNVTVESMLSLDFTRSGKSKSFFGTGVRLDLWHLVLLLNY